MKLIDPVEDVYHFQKEVLKNDYPNKPVLANEELKTRSLVCLREELDEFEKATKISEQADAIIDLIYFGYGVLHQMGVDSRGVWDEVHRANITKVRGKTHRGHDNDAKKPEDWTPPNHEWLDE